MGISDVDLSTIHRWRRIAIDAVAPFHDEWLENSRYYLGVQWEDDTLEKLPIWRSAPVVNLILPIVEQAHALLTDQRPITYVYRQNGGTARIERILNSLLEQIWVNENVEETVARVQKDRLITGTGFYKITWDKKDKKRVIPMNIERIAPEYMFFDPLAEDIQDARYIFERDEIPLAELIDEFPHMYDEIKSSNHEDIEGLVDFDGTVFDVPKVNVWDCWFKDSTLIEEVITNDEDGEEQVVRSKRKYPNGRHIKFVGDIVLVDEKNPYPWFPYVKSNLVKVRSEMWGLSIVTPLKIVQDEINEIEADLLDNIKVNAHPMWIATEGSVDLEEFVAAPNTLIELRGGLDSKLDRLPGIQMPPEVFNMEQKKINDLFRISGVNDVTFGNVVGSSRPGAVKQNFEASITRIREYTRLNNRALSELGEKMIDLIQKFLPADTVVAISSPDDDVADLFDPMEQRELFRVMQKQSVQEEIRFRDITLNQTTDEFAQRFAELTGVQGLSEELARDLLKKDSIEEFKNNIQEGRYGYRVDIHPMQPHDRQSMFELIGILMQYGLGEVVDAEAIWDILELPGKHKIINRIRRNKLQQAQAAQDQALQQQNIQQQQAQQGAQ